MSLDRVFPSKHPLARIRTFGAPYHGLVESGTLTLPNADTMPHAQPASADYYWPLFSKPWLGASVLYFRRPGWVMPARTPDQIAADAAIGREWRDYALLSGGNRMYAGQALRGWVWHEPGGGVWAVRLVNIVGSISATSLHFELAPVCRFSRNPPAVLSRATPAFSLGQSGAPTLEYRPGPTEPMQTLAEDAPADLICVSQTPDGSKSLWMRSIEHYAGDHATGMGGALRDRPVAFIEVTVHPDRTVTASTIRSRAQCMGSITRPISVPESLRRIKFNTNASDSVSEGTCPTGQTIWHFEITPSTTVSETPITSPTYTVPAARAISGGMTGQIIAMWYDTAGQLHEISISAEIDFDRTSSGSTSESGAVDVIFSCETLSYVRTGSITWVRTDNIDVTEKLSIQLIDNGVPVAGSLIEYIRHSTGTVSCTRIYNADESGSFTYSYTCTDTVTLNGTELAETTTTNPDMIDWESRFSDFGFWLTPGEHTDAQAVARQLSAIPAAIATPPSTELGQLRLGYVRWSNIALGTHYQRIDPDSGEDSLNRHEFGPVTSPYGDVTYSATLDYDDPTNIVCSGSLQPVTLQFAARVTEEVDPHNSVCWV